MHKLAGHELKVSALITDPERKKADESAGKDSQATCAILVEGIDSNTGKDVLEMFFENKKRSGGGEIERIQMFPKDGRAIIRFADKEGKVVLCN